MSKISKSKAQKPRPDGRGLNGRNIKPRPSGRGFLCLALLAAPLFAGFDTRVGSLPGGPSVIDPNARPPLLKSVGIDEKLGAQVDLSLVFTDENGSPVALRDYFHPGRPVILNLVYYTCPMLCSLILNGQVNTLKEIPWTPGNEYEVVTISIDPRDSSEIARQKKQGYLASFGRSAPGWHFLTDYKENVKRLAEQAGFRYEYDRAQKQYAHAAAIMILTPEGKMARYLYGVDFKPRDVRLALAEASQGRSSMALEKLLLFCYHYDPQANRYVLFAENVMRAGGILTILIVGFTLWRLFRNERLAREGMA